MLHPPRASDRVDHWESKKNEREDEKLKLWKNVWSRVVEDVWKDIGTSFCCKPPSCFRHCALVCVYLCSRRRNVWLLKRTSSAHSADNARRVLCAVMAVVRPCACSLLHLCVISFLFQFSSLSRPLGPKTNTYDAQRNETEKTTCEGNPPSLSSA